MLFKNKKNYREKSYKKQVIIGVLVICLIGAGLYVILHHSHSSLVNKKTVKQTSSPQHTQTVANNTNPDVPTPTSTSNVPGGSTVGNTTLTLVAPSGTFVSNHHPNLSGSPAPNTETSICQTTSGASCVISFSKDGVTKSLTAQTADKDGTTSWNWTLQQVDLSAGSWKITATATLNGQSKTTSDSLALEVSQ